MSLFMGCTSSWGGTLFMGRELLMGMNIFMGMNLFMDGDIFIFIQPLSFSTNVVHRADCVFIPGVFSQ